MSQTSVSFSNQLVNTTSTATTVTVTNNGTASLVISDVKLTGANAGEFTFNAPARPITVVAGSSTSVQLTFAPTGYSGGDRSAALTITDNAGGSPHALALSGHATAPRITTNVVGGAVEYGTLGVGSTAQQSIIVHNEGDGDLTVSNASISGSTDFTVTPASFTVHAGQSQTLNASFVPTASGKRAGTLMLTDNSASAAHALANLSGTGVDNGPAQASDASVALDPGTVSPTPTQYPTTFTVNITGTDTNFTAGATTANFGPGAIVTDGTSTALPGQAGLVQVTDPTHAQATVTMDGTVAPGPRSIIVSTGGHDSAATFVVPARDGAPIANAGAPQYVSTQNTVYLDGSGSTPGLAAAQSAARTSAASSATTSAMITYTWTLLSKPAGSNATLDNPSSVRPSFTPDQPGAYYFQLTVSNGTASTTTWTNVVYCPAGQTCNSGIPVASAGPDQFVTAGTLVHLNGSGSNDADGEGLTFTWSFVAKPTDSTATLSDPTAVAPTFTADKDGDYLLQLIVNDGNGNTAADITDVSTVAVPPIAKAGDPQKVAVNGPPVILNGSASSSPSGDAITCTWSFVSMPAGSAAALSNAGPQGCGTHASFIADVDGNYVVQLAVSDGHNNTSLATTTIVAGTAPVSPIANAGAARTVNVGDFVQLDGSKSSDPDGDSSLKYKWSILSKPTASTAALSQDSVVNPQFQADVDGDYLFQLVVTDSENLSSLPATVLISAHSPAFEAQPTSLDFGLQTVNITSDSKTITLKNTGGGPLTISDIQKGGANAGDFAFTSAALPVIVPAGQTTQINVTFTPSAAGTESATLTITHNATGGSALIQLSGSGATPTLQLTPAQSLPFPDQLVNTTSAAQTVTVNNTGNGILKVTNIAVTGAQASEFTATPSTLSVDPGQSGTISITFTPTATGTRNATLTLTDNGAGSPQSIALSGNGTAPGFLADVATLDFAKQLIATPSSGKTVTITNTGTAPLHILAPTITGTNATDFAITSGGSAVTVDPTKTAAITVKFTPAAVGDKSATLTIKSDGGSDYPVTLSGTGIAPDLSTDVTSLAFPDTLVGQNSVKTVTITNSGTADLHLTSATLSNTGDFTVDSVPTTAIPPSNQVQLHVTFKPGASGAITGKLTINSDAVSGAAVINLSGTGLAPGISLDKSSLDFGNQLLNQSSQALTITVTNNGNSQLTVSALNFGGTNAGDFTSVTVLPLKIDANKTGTISVGFTPSALGARSATLSITSDAPTQPQPVTLSGTGTQPGINVSPLSFGNQTVGVTGASALTITNSGTATLHISGLSITAGAPEFAVTSSAPIDIDAGKTGTLNLTFTPSQMGARTGELTITSNAPGGTTKVALSGTGIEAIIGASPVSFGTQNMTLPPTSASATLTVSNTGNTELDITAIGFAGTNPGDFSFGTGFTAPTQATPLKIAANSSTQIPLLFTPQSTGTRTATLNFTSNSPTNPFSVTLTGVGTAPGAPTFSPAPVISNQIVGTTSATIPVTVTNPADASGNLIITAITISGASASEFATTTTATAQNPITVAPGATTTINLTFTPSAAGARNASLSITDNALGSPHAVALQGTGSTSSISPASLQGFTAVVGTASTAQTLTLSYPSGAAGALSLSSVSITGANATEFAATNATLPAPITGTQTQQVSITFNPLATGGAGARSATLNITDSTGKAYSIPLSGTAQAPNISVPSPLAFPDTIVNATSPTVPLVITNTGTANLHISAFSITGTNASEFSIPATNGIDIGANGGTATVNLTFKPAGIGARTATLNIADNASGSPHQVTLNGNGIAPGVGFNPTSLSFNPQTVNTQSSPMSVEVKNTGTSTLNVTAIGFTGPNATDFSTTTAPFTLPPNGTTTVNVSFKPSVPAGGPETAALVLTDDTLTGSDQLALSGTGVLPTVTTAPANGLTFAGQLVNTTSAAQNVTITNSGAGVLFISGLSFTGPNATEYGFGSGFTQPTQGSPITVQPNASVQVPIVFAPKAAGASRTATLNITSNTAQATVSLTGTAIAPQITLTPATTLPFGNVLKGTTSTTQNVTINNPGTADLTISNIAIPTSTYSADFSFATTLTFPMTIAAGGSAQIGLIFKPTLAVNSQETAALNFTSDAGNPTLSLTGTSIAPVFNAPIAGLSFGNVNVDNTSTKTMNITVGNVGMADLHITAISFGGTNPGDFSLPANLTYPITVAANTNTTIAVTFMPKAVGSRSASITFTGDATNSPQQATLTGTGVGVPVFSPSPTSMDFGSINVGSASAAQLITITNTGSAALTVGGLIKTGSYPGDFYYTVNGNNGSSDWPETLQPGGSITVSVKFQPSAGGTRSANLVFEDGNFVPLTPSVAVTGVGIPPTPTIALSTTTMSYPNTLVGSPNAGTALVLTNNGTGDLSVSSVSISGTNASDFMLSNTPTSFTVAKGGGTYNVKVTFTPSDSGTRTATLTIVSNAGNSTLPAGCTGTAGNMTCTITLSGTGYYIGNLQLNPTTVAKNMQKLGIGSVTVAPSNPLQITITSNSPGLMLLDPVATDPSGASQGVASFIGTLPAGHGVNDGWFPGFYIQALTDTGTATITMSAPGYKSVTTTITFQKSGFTLAGSAGVGGNFSTPLGTATNLTAAVYPLDPVSSNPITTDNQTVRGGFGPVSVTVTSSNTTTGTITGSPASVASGTSATAAGALKFQPNAAGTSNLSVTQPNGFSAPATGAQLTATVAGPKINDLPPTSVGYDLQVPQSAVTLNTAPPSNLQVTITSSDPTKAVLSTSPTVTGTGSIIVTVPAGSTSVPTFYIQGTGVGSVTLTATAPGYTQSQNGPVSVTPSGFLIDTPSGNFTTTTLSSPTNLSVTVYQLNGTGGLIAPGTLAGGLSPLNVTVTSTSSSSAGTIGGTNPLTFQAGGTTVTGAQFVPNPNCTAPCTATVSVSQPSGFLTPSSGASITATVTVPQATIRMTQTTVGSGLQTLASGALDAPAPQDMTVTISSSNSNVSLACTLINGSPDINCSGPTGFGAQSITLTIHTGGGVNSNGFPNYYVQGMANSGTATLTVTPQAGSGFGQSTFNVAVAPAGFVLVGPNGAGADFGTVNGSTTPLTVQATVLDSNLNPTNLVEMVNSGFSANVAINSNNPSVATVSPSPVPIPGGTSAGAVTLQAVQYSSGKATISLTQPAGFTQPASGDHLVVTVN